MPAATASTSSRSLPAPDAIDELKAAVAAAKASDRSTLIHIESDPLLYAPDGEGWWDVPVAETSTLEATQRARAEYELEQRGAAPAARLS